MASVDLLEQSGLSLGSDPHVEREAHQSVELVLGWDDVQAFYYSGDSCLHVVGKPIGGLFGATRHAYYYIGPGVAIADCRHAALIKISAKAASLEFLDQSEPHWTKLHHGLLLKQSADTGSNRDQQ